jgi:LEA14-like dessication related protein
MPTPYRAFFITLVLILLAGCATLGLREPVKVAVVGLEPLPGEGLEARFALKLRIQNPNETDLHFDGVSVDLELADIDFGSGVSGQRGTVPRYGEALVTVPVTVPFLAIVRQVYGLTGGQPRDRVSYRLRGHLGGTGIPGVRFDTRGDLLLPAERGRRY